MRVAIWHGQELRWRVLKKHLHLIENVSDGICSGMGTVYDDVELESLCGACFTFRLKQKCLKACPVLTAKLSESVGGGCFVAQKTTIFARGGVTYRNMVTRQVHRHFGSWLVGIGQRCNP